MANKLPFCNGTVEERAEDFKGKDYEIVKRHLQAQADALFVYESARNELCQAGIPPEQHPIELYRTFRKSLDEAYEAYSSYKSDRNVD